MQVTVILGCPRSGTTFLDSVLDALPRSEVRAGLIFPPPLAHLAAASEDDGTSALLERALATGIEEWAEQATRTRASAVVAAMRGTPSPRELIAGFQGRRVLESFIYKEPFLAFAPQLPWRAVPDSQIIHIYRDGRDCADSLIRKYKVLSDESLLNLASNEMPLGRPVKDRFVPWWVAPSEDEEFLRCTPYLRAVWMWREMLRRCNDFFSSPGISGSGRVLNVRYEELMSEPIRVGHEILSHIGRAPTRTVERRLNSAHTQSIGIHRLRALEEVRLATDIARPELERLGYV